MPNKYKKTTSIKMKRLMILTSCIFIFSCSKSNYIVESEIFNKSERPQFEYNSDSDFYFCKPWNYEKDTNLNKKYPLIIYLHGAGSAGKINYLNYLGYDSNFLFENVEARNFQLNYPCFVLVPQTSTSWDNNSLINLIENTKKNYRIDLNRIYLIGYSMGGSGSYSLANAYYKHNKHLFAGIIRLAGQSQTTLEDSIIKNTSVWLHIGLKDSDLRIQITREAYNYLKINHPQAIETKSQPNMTTYSGTTVTLTENGREIAKKTEYNNVGHGINNLPFADDYLLKWLFNQKLE